MPTCADGYISKEIDEIKKRWDNASVLWFAEVLHSCSTGCMEAENDKLKEAETVVQFYIDHWVNSEGSLEAKVFDASVWMLLITAMREWKACPLSK